MCIYVTVHLYTYKYSTDMGTPIIFMSMTSLKEM